MTKKQKKEHILTNLSLNHCNISDAIEEVCAKSEYEEFIDSDQDFKSEVNRLKDKRDDFVRTVQMDLIASGDSKQVLEYLKEVSKSSDGDTLGGIQREAMIYIIKTADNNTTAIEIFMKIFGCTKYRSNQIFSDALSQNDLESPTVRSKNKEENIERSLFRRMERGELTKAEMYKELMINALYMAQFSARDDVKIKAGQLVKDYDKHLVDEEERMRREAESDDEKLIDKCDAQLCGVKPSDITEVRESFKHKALEVDDA